MASSMSLPIFAVSRLGKRVLIVVVKIPKPKETDQPEGEQGQKKEAELELPQTLVRIPTEHAPMLQQATEGAVEE